MRALLIDLDGALGDTRPLWRDWLAHAAGVLGIEPAALSPDRGAAAATLDALGGGNWRTLLARYAAERAPVYLRPSAEASGALRRLAASGRPLGVFTDAPDELARVALAQLGAARRLHAVEAGPGALARLRHRLGEDAAIAQTRDDLVIAAG